MPFQTFGLMVMVDLKKTMHLHLIIPDINQDWYFIKLYAIGANGCIDSTDNGVNTTRAHLPQISLTYDTIACNHSIHFNNTTMGRSEFVWDFGDGSPFGHDYYATHAYAVAGNYVVTLTASNGSSCLSTYSFIVRAPQGWNLALPKANFNYTITACTNTIKMNDLSSNHSSRAWYFDGNLVSNMPNDSIVGAAAGVHTLQLVVMNGTCSDTLSQAINIQNAPTGTFDFVASTCSKTVAFTSNLSNANSFKWHFGDAGSALDSAIGSSTSHTFSSNGDYIVHLDVTNLSGCVYSMVDTITVNGGTHPLDASFHSNNTNCDCYCSNKIKFVNTSSGYASSYLWNFGDGNTSTQMNPNKGYAAIGNYNVSLTVSDTNGCFSTASARSTCASNCQRPEALHLPQIIHYNVWLTIISTSITTLLIWVKVGLTNTIGILVMVLLTLPTLLFTIKNILVWVHTV
jgi:PKD repeat protein